LRFCPGLVSNWDPSNYASSIDGITIAYYHAHAGPGWLWIAILLTSVSWEDGITGVSYQAWHSFLLWICGSLGKLFFFLSTLCICLPKWVIPREEILHHGLMCKMFPGPTFLRERFVYPSGVKSEKGPLKTSFYRWGNWNPKCELHPNKVTWCSVP
jgi:hypothetical protein